MNKSASSMSARAKALTSIGLLLAAVLFAASALWYWAEVTQAQLTEVVQASFATSAAGQQDKLQMLRKESRSTQEARERLRALALPELEVPEFLNELEGVTSGEARVFVRAVNVGSGNTDTVQISLAFSGALSDVTSIVQSIATIKESLYTDSVEMRRDALGDWDVSMRIVLPLILK